MVRHVLVYTQGVGISWNLNSASYDGVAFYVGTQDVTMRGVEFSYDGTKFYACGNGNDTVYQYTLGTPWDLSTASYASLFKLIAGQSGFPGGLYFKSDGTKMYVVDSITNMVYQYTLGTAWDVSSATYDSVFFDVGVQDNAAYSLSFRPNGTKMYVVGNTNDSIFQYTLGTPWDLSTASYDSVLFGVGGQDVTPHGVDFSTDGNKMFVVGNTNTKIFQYTLGTAWDVSSATYDSVFFDASSEGGALLDFEFKSNGLKMYTLTTLGWVHQYSL